MDENGDGMEKDTEDGEGGDTEDEEDEEEASKPNDTASEDEVSNFALSFSLL